MRKEEGLLPRLLRCINKKKEKWAVVFGEEQNGDSGNYSWMEEVFDHKPTEVEVRTVIADWVNAKTEERILNGPEVDGVRVWLSKEQQLNFQGVFAMAMQEGDFKPLWMKIGERDGAQVFKKFETKEEFKAFYGLVHEHIQRCLTEGWEEKQKIDTKKYFEEYGG